MAVEAFAPAKINLTLHVTGRRGDGYHDLDSLVVFADIGDCVTAVALPEGRRGVGLSLSGPQAAGLSAGEDNLVMRAARAMGEEAAHLTLDKHLPAAAGLGGGSADAAATLRALARLRGRALPPRAAQLALGADVPVCVDSRPCRMSGVGAQLAPVPDLPPIWLVLANPDVAVPTARVFDALAHSDGAPMPAEIPDWEDAAALATWLRGQRNDLETPARGLFPAIGAVLGALSGQEGCLMARMSGSGATCFGLFADPPAAMAAAETIARAAPAWWVRAAGLAGPVS